MNRPGIFTDYYELTMAQGYFLEGRAEETACFEYFFRELPFNGGYVVFAGLSDFLSQLENFNFKETELEFLRQQGFTQKFLDYLRSLTLSISVRAPKEGEIIFPLEPILRVEGNLIEAQIVETLLLNLVNFESLIATKAMRMKYAAGNKGIFDFGLRRAQGFGGIQSTKAAMIGGAQATSNVYAALQHAIPLSGTMAHSWIQSFENELTAFRAYAAHYPNNCILLVDTYNTLESGLPNAIKVAKELEKKGFRLKGIRLDSGDLTYLSKKSRTRLNAEGLEYVKIVASNQLDEYVIRSLCSQGAPIDLFGAGTRLVTGGQTSALDGVYKLSEINGRPNLKISENIEKTTFPGKKETLRYFKNDEFYADAIQLEKEDPPSVIYHPFISANHKVLDNYRYEPLMKTVVKHGKRIINLPSVAESAKYATDRFKKLPQEYKRFENPHVFKVGISKKLMDLRDDLIKERKKQKRETDNP